ncbi:MAG: acetyltransferase [Peptococcales bacterium]|jgi:sugar O-acyltransferase (sialic acid O-acetyltransferase NeuD family)
MILAIYGAGGLGKEICDTVISNSSEEYDEIIFIDDDVKIKSHYGNVVHTFERFKEVYNVNECRVIIAIGEPSVRAILYERVKNNGYNVTSIIHSTAILSSTSIIGEGTYIGPYSFVSSDASVGKNIIIQPHAMIGHDVSIGDSSVISTNVVLAGNCSIGTRSFIALNVSVEQKIHVGDDTIIGMASCVNRDIPSDVIAMGYPARVLKKNELRRVF